MFTDTYRRFVEKQDEEAFGESLYEAEQQHEALEQMLKQMEDQHEQRRSRPRRDQHEQRLSRPSLSRGDYVMKTMERRYAKGEFGEAANFAIEGYNKAMKQMLDEERERQWKLPYKRELNARTFTKFNPVCSLWAKEGIKEGINDPSKKVMFECNAVQKEVGIPAGVKVLVLKNTGKNNEKSPDASVVYLTEEIL